MMILRLRKNSTSYFRPYRDYFIAIYGSFLLFPIREIFLIFLQGSLVIRVSTQAMIGGAIVIAMLWGDLATRLYVYPGRFSIRYALTKPKRPIDYFFILYTLPMVAILVGSFTLPGAIADIPVQAAYPLSSATSATAGIGTNLLAIAAIVTVAFVGYPFLILVRLRSQLKDREVRYALRVIAVCFGIISALLLILNALDTFGVNISGLGHLISVSLLFVVGQAFSKPSFLKSFLGVTPSLETRYEYQREDMRVLIYRKGGEKFVPISRFVREGIGQESQVAYFYKGQAEEITDGLVSNGLDVRQSMMKRSLRLIPFTSLYQSEGILDEEAALSYLLGMVQEARALGKNSLKLIVDYEDYSERPYTEFINHLTDSRWTTPDHFVSVLMAFSEAAFQDQEAALNLLESKIASTRISDANDTFSRTVGLSHSEIIGRKILLEYDPGSDYEKVINSLLGESSSNFERAAIFTRRDSPLYSVIGKQPGMKIFVLTSRVSYPRVEESHVLLPAYDSSLLLDAINKTIEAYAGTNCTIIFDGISHYVFTLGPDRTLSLVRQGLELMVSDKVTAVFLLNAGAHDQKTISTFENLFDLELVSREGARIPEVKRRLTLAAER